MLKFLMLGVFFVLYFYFLIFVYSVFHEIHLKIIRHYIGKKLMSSKLNKENKIEKYFDFCYDLILYDKGVKNRAKANLSSFWFQLNGDKRQKVAGVNVLIVAFYLVLTVQLPFTVVNAENSLFLMIFIMVFPLVLMVAKFASFMLICRRLVNQYLTLKC